jgi:hypothetical protein
MWRQGLIRATLREFLVAAALAGRGFSGTAADKAADAVALQYAAEPKLSRAEHDGADRSLPGSYQ